MATLVAMTVSAEAGNITEKQAKEIASKFLSSSQVSTRSAGSVTLQLAMKSTGYYAFNRPNGAGYVVVASSDQGCEQVLGYADGGSFSTSDMPDNMEAWLEEYDRQIAFAEAHPRQQASATMTDDSRQAIAPLVTAKWNQEEPYNGMCPQIDDANCPTGCVATAMAQVMYFHKWPKQGQGSVSYLSEYTDPAIPISVDFSQSTYNWDAMTDEYNDVSTQESKDAVALLMRDVGAASQMNYTQYGSATSKQICAMGMTKYFDYDKSISYILRNFYTHGEWENLIYSELANRRPVLLGGYGKNSNSGHAFVVDGYKDGYYHVNWGWSGRSDGYFKLSALAPYSQGVGGTSSDYSYSQNAVVGIQPNTHSSTLVAPNVVCGPMSVSYSSASEVAIDINLGYIGFEDRDFKCGVKIKSDKGDSTYLVAPAQTFSFGMEMPSVTIPLSSFNLEDGTYTLSAIVYDTATERYYEPRTQKIGTDGGSFYLTAEVNNGTITFSMPDATKPSSLKTDITLPSPLHAGMNYIAEIAVTALDDNYYGDVTLRFAKDSVYTDSGTFLVDLDKGGSDNVKSLAVAPTQPGQYKAYLVDESGFALGDTISVTVADSIKSALGFEAKGARMEKTTDVDPNDVRMEFDVKCTGGSYAGQFYIFIFKANVSGTSTNYILSDEVMALKEGDEANVVFSSPLSELNPSTAYICKLYYRDATGMHKITPEDSASIVFTTAAASAISSVAVNAEPSVIKIYSLSGTLVDSQYAATPSLESLPKGVYVIEQGGKTKKVVR